uniref:Acyltransferase C-terminal domain-containing protein n=1 Tax=Dendroctonus ponderosae TaxID=77166 RepID=A0AAR5QFZ6_DENPD
KYEHVLHPRSTGFVYLVDEMRKRNCLDAVYDLTLIYPDDCPQNEEQLFFQGKFPTNVLAHLVRYPVPALPDNKEGLKVFLEQRWLEKEQTMNEFRKTGNFLYHGSALNRDRYLSKAWAYFTQLIWLGLSCVMIYFLFAHVMYFWLVTVYTLSLYVIPLFKFCLRTIGNLIFRKSSRKMKLSVSE